jgi:hypothetical protein
MLLGVVDEDIADAERAEPEERKPRMVPGGEAQRQPAQRAPGK